MMKDLEKQKKAVHEAVQTVLIVNDMESRYRLCIEFMKIMQLMPMTDDEVMAFRQRYGLNTAVWILAEKEIEETENHN